MWRRCAHLRNAVYTLAMLPESRDPNSVTLKKVLCTFRSTQSSVDVAVHTRLGLFSQRSVDLAVARSAPNVASIGPDARQQA